MAPLWILGLISLPSPSPLFVMFSQSSSFRRNLVFSQHHRLFLSRHFFLRLRYPVSLQPNLLLSFLASVHSTVVLPSLRSLLSPRLISDFLCPSQLLPFFSLYGLLMARLWRFGFLFCSSVSFFLEPPSSVVIIVTHYATSLRGRLLIGVSFLPSRFVLHRSPPFSSASVTSCCFMDLCYCLSCCLMHMD
jgi:hypothetical protein